MTHPFMNDPRAKDPDGRLAVGTCLRLLEDVTKTNEQFWRTRLGLGDGTWRNWLNWRSPNSALARERDIRIELDCLGYDVADGLLTDRPSAAEDFTSRFAARVADDVASYSEFDLTPLSPEVVRTMALRLGDVRPLGRGGSNPRSAMVVGASAAVRKAFLEAWVKTDEYKPSVPIVHLDAAKYSDASILLMRLLEVVCSDMTEGVRTTFEEKIEALRSACRTRKFVLVLENIDRYADRDLFNGGNDFRMSPSGFHVNAMVFACFLTAPGEIAAKLVMTAEKPLHLMTRNFPVIDLSGLAIPVALEARVLVAEPMEGLLARDVERRSVKLLMSEFPLEKGISALPNSIFRRGSWPMVFEAGVVAKTTDHLLRMLPQSRTVLRLLAASDDGLRPSTLLSLIDRIGGDIKFPFRSQEDVRQALEAVRGLITEKHDRLGEGETSFEIGNSALRVAILASWEQADVREARKVYREVGVLALERAECCAFSSELHNPVEELERTIQASQALLASADPRDLREPLARNDAGRVRRRLLERKDVATTDIMQFCYRELWRDRLEKGPSYQLIRRFGMIDGKFRLLVHLLMPGTAIPHVSTDLSRMARTGLNFLTGDEEVGLCTALAITATSLGRHVFAAKVAQATEDSRRATTLSQRKSLGKIHVDSLIRCGSLDDAEERIEILLAKLCGWQKGTPAVEGILRRSPEEHSKLLRCSIDFLSRLGEVQTLKGKVAKAAEAFGAARACHAELTRGFSHSQPNPFLASNGRRFIAWQAAAAIRCIALPGASFGEAAWHLTECRDHAEQNAYEHDIAGCAIDHARLKRLMARLNAHHPEGLVEHIDHAMSLSLGFGVSPIIHLEASAEKAKILLFEHHNAERDRRDGLHANALRQANHLLDEARSLRLPVFEAEARLLLCEVSPGRFEEHLGFHDKLCTAHGIGIFEHPRSLLVHGQKPTLIGAW